MTYPNGNRKSLSVNEWAEREGVKPDTARSWIHRGLIRARDLNAGDGKRPRWRIPASQQKPERG
jgi:predicted site-specific integrase-resolvase